MQFWDTIFFLNWLPILITVILVAGIIFAVLAKTYITRFGHKIMVFDENTIEFYKVKKTDNLLKFKGKTVTKKYTGRLAKSGLKTNRIYILEDGKLITTDFYPTIKHLQETYEEVPLFDKKGKQLFDENGEALTKKIKKKQEVLQDEEGLDDSAKQQIIESGVLDKFLSVFKNVGFSWQTFLFGLFTGIAVIMIAVQMGVI